MIETPKSVYLQPFLEVRLMAGLLRAIQNSPIGWRLQAVKRPPKVVVLLPVRRETHATPGTNIRPQEAINEELFRPSDILIGMF